MKGRTNLLLMGGGIAALLMLGLAAALLVRGILRLNKTESRLAQEKGVLERYYRADPFPSMENVAREEENLAVQERWFQELVHTLAEGQVVPVSRSPSSFMSLLGDTRSQLAEQAKRLRDGRGQKEAVIPDGFAFGFDRYFAEGGVLPAPADVPRLMQQLVIVENLCKILFDEKVTELSRVRREEFEESVTPLATGSEESPDEARGSRLTRSSGRTGRSGRSVSSGAEDDRPVNRAAGELGEGDLFTALRFNFEFRANEAVVLAVLNRLASSKMFIVVTGLELTKTKPEVLLADQMKLVWPTTGGTNEAAAATQEFPRRRQRLASGLSLETPMSVALELNVYRFRGE